MRILSISTPAEVAWDKERLKLYLIHSGVITEDEDFLLLKRSIDARHKVIKTHLKLQVHRGTWKEVSFKPNYQDVRHSREVIIVGAGPAGIFAALKCLQLGIKPIVIERGKAIPRRRRDVAFINKKGEILPESNYCFGEGGAGTFSDGKLYTRSHKRGHVQEILNLLVYHGADRDILVDAHPHIGTNKLPQVIQNMRETILEHGGEMWFESKVVDLIIENQAVHGVILEDGTKVRADAVVLATGHSARDIYELLYQKGIKIVAKPLAMGIRIEHPQVLIDQMQYHCHERPHYLPPAAYSWVQQIEGRGVYSFCMCPGGIIAPCATNPNEIVTNGWSPSRRNNPYSNSGIVVELQMEDIPEPFSKYGNFAFLEFQKYIENQAFIAGNGRLKAPAQRLVDFTQSKFSSDLPKCSYFPGLTCSNLREWLPKVISEKLVKAFLKISQKMKPYFTNEAVVVGVETRTSAPVRIPRNPTTGEHVQIQNLYPCGEGAGYAGGIVSAALDGQKIIQLIRSKWS